MNKPKQEPEVVRAKVARFVDELREALRDMGWSDRQVAEVSSGAEKRAMVAALTPGAEDNLRY